MSDTSQPQLKYTSLDEIDAIHTTLRESFRAGKLRSIAARKVQILQLAYLLKDNCDRFKAALAADLGRPSLESSFLELDLSIGDCKIAYDQVEKWARTEKAPFNLNFFAFRPVIRKEPKGVVLSISPFNYPVWLSFGPMIGALAAGNCFVLKPSELSSSVSNLIAELVPKYLDPAIVRVVLGAVPETTKLLELPWAHILYTGNGRVARIVCAAAAKTLSPVTTELGGKSPVVIDPRCNLKTATKRIMWGKCTNAGQTCVAPDYILVQEHAEDAVVQGLKEAYHEFYPDGPSSQGAFCRIINHVHFRRLKNLLDRTAGTIAIGGDTNEDDRFIAPTVVRGVKGDDSLMSEELFGPILPIVPVKDVDAAIAFINERDHPLALYVFSQDEGFKTKVFDNTQSGSAVANEVMIQCAIEGLPLGGIGASGSGYHGRKFTFDLFTHLRSALDSPSWVDVVFGSRFPPYTPKKETFLHNITGVKLPPRPRTGGSTNGAVECHSLSSNDKCGYGAIVVVFVVLAVVVATSQVGVVEWVKRTL